MKNFIFILVGLILVLIPYQKAQVHSESYWLTGGVIGGAVLGAGMGIVTGGICSDGGADDYRSINRNLWG